MAKRSLPMSLCQARKLYTDEVLLDLLNSARANDRQREWQKFLKSTAGKRFLKEIRKDLKK